MVSNKLPKEEVLERADQLDFPSSVVEFFQGYLGQPVGGFPEPFRSKVIRNKPRIDGRPGANLPPVDLNKTKAELRSKFGKHITDADVSSYIMYPKVCLMPDAARLTCGMTTTIRSSKTTKGSLRSTVT